MIYITGDTHSDFQRFTKMNFPEQNEMDKTDHVIICGDFGGVWYPSMNSADSANSRYFKYCKAENHNLDELDSRSFTTLFIPGNHENYDRLMSDEFPTVDYCNGKVKQIRPSVLMLLRGEMYTIEDVKIFAFGGAASHDIHDGLLDSKDPDWKKKAKELDRNGKYMYRVKGLSWWPEEMPNEKEMQHGIDTLEENDWNCDFVVTHCAPSSTQTLLRGFGFGRFQLDSLTNYLEEIRCKLSYKKWFFGHYHDNHAVNDKEILLYEQIIRIR